jgi:hypothetical protein
MDYIYMVDFPEERKDKNYINRVNSMVISP